MSIQLSRVEWQQRAILVSARTSLEGVKYIEMSAFRFDVTQLSGQIPECNLTCIQCYLCCRGGNSGQRCVKCLSVVKLHTRGRKRKTSTSSSGPSNLYKPNTNTQTQESCKCLSPTTATLHGLVY